MDGLNLCLFVYSDMWGKHPKTGKPIRILQLDTSIWKDKKTLSWGSDIIAGARNATKGARILILAEPQYKEEDAQWLSTGDSWQRFHIILASKETLNSIGEERLKEMKIGNLICLEECKELYPFLEGPWDGTVEDASVIAAMLLRSAVLEQDHITTKRPHVQIQSIVSPRPELWLITQFYKPESAKRGREIQKCLRMNLECPLIDRVVLLTENDFTAEYTKMPNQDKIQQDVVGKRLTYAMVIRWIAEKAPANTICVFANSDIYLDKTWEAIWQVSLENRFLSLLRYEATPDTPDEEHKLFGPRPDSQDTWVVLSDSVKSRTWNYDTLDFPFGKAGCDNAINVEMLRNKFLIANPSLTLKTHHVHSSQIRNYDPAEIVDKPMYLYIEPTGLQDMKPIFSPPPYKTLPGVPFSRPIHGPTEAQKKTFCSMLERDQVYKLEPTGSNLFTPVGQNIYKDDGVFMTHTGLAYTYNSLYVGRAEAGSNAWAKAQISGLSPSLYVEKGLVAPFPEEYMENPETYLLKYLSNILILRKHAEGGEFYAPRDKPFLDSLQIFDWGKKEVPVFPRDPQFQAWAKEAYILLPSDTAVLTKQQITALREALRFPWVDSIEEDKRTVIIADERVCTREFIRNYEAITDVDVIWPGSTNMEILIRKLSGASKVIVEGGDLRRWGWFWLLPRGASVYEIQNEMPPSAELLQLCGAADLEHTLFITPKGTLSEATKKAVLEFTTAKKIQTAPKSDLPLLILPSGHQDLFAHAGDSFREMARIWADKGYVKIVEDPLAHHVWLNGIGDTLLYDRPTYEWLDASPPEEKRWRVALFGNPAPRGPNSKAWAFWARRPALVEKLVEERIHLNSYALRTQNLVFYGRIENQTQKKRRTGLDWGSVCTEFSMPIGADGYPFTQEEYLRKLANARFGLCLPGYGLKCHREVECMLMGCVPIVTPEVDMQNYDEQLKVGVHYFVAKTPEEARKLAFETDSARWEDMSLACLDWSKRNIRAEGFWRLTQSLSSK